MSLPFIPRSTIYDAIEMHSQKVKTSSTTDYVSPLVSGNNEMLSTAKSKQYIKANTMELQGNPAYAATD